MRFSFWRNEELLNIHPNISSSDFYVDNNFEHFVEQGNAYTLKKYVSIVSTVHHSEFSIIQRAINKVREAYVSGFNSLLDAHKTAWKNIWSKADVVIEGDVASQQGIRFNIFQLYQT